MYAAMLAHIQVIPTLNILLNSQHAHSQFSTYTCIAHKFL